MNKICVIGIGYRPLNARASELMLSAEIILASKRLHEVFTRYEEFKSVKEKVRVINKVDDTMEFLRSYQDAQNESQHLVLLASGDPLFFGIGRKVLDEFGHDTVEIFPDLSSIQLAFAAIGEPWDNAFLMSLHGGPDPEKRRRLPYELKDIPALLEQHNKIAVLTDKENNPSVIASFLNSSPITHHPSLVLHVCERLGYPDEKITAGPPEEISGMTFMEPNVLIIMRNTSLLSFPPVGNPSAQKDCEYPNIGHKQAAMAAELRFGFTENEISHSRGLITKDEVRAVSIHKLRLPHKGVLWDIGAGSGAVSLEAGRLSPGLRVYAIEKNEEQLVNIRDNVARLGMANIAIISGQAPDVLSALPFPDRVFIGGSSGRLSEIMALVMDRMLKGVIVLNAVAIETLNDALMLFEKNGLGPEVSLVSVSRSRIVNGQRHMSALNPIYVIKGEKR